MKLEALTTHLAKDMSIKKVCIIAQNYAYGQQIRKSAREYLAKKRPGITIVGDDLHPIGQVKDFSPYIAKIKASGADVVLMGNWGPDFTLLVKAAKEAGLNTPLHAFSAIQYGAPTPVGESGVGRLFSIFPWHANNEGFQGVDYVDAYKKKHNEDFFIMSSRTIFTMMGQAIRNTKSVDPVKVAFALEGMKIDGPVGQIEMRKEDHQVQQPLYLLSWDKVNGKDVKYDMENTGFEWKTVKKIDAYVAAQPTSCQMKRPARS
ncbi:ABC transporter substrate-binding protein [Noviherbaspirillum aerium]|uniref:ABC transporter substrate-binding protein n=1 Tax=Noviherbaspirillum aerium TaxID=2588497 RepID=UPI00124D4170|nr:ABC transporter substrate-binding protein [Noviherbaspirillum aerium]